MVFPDQQIKFPVMLIIFPVPMFREISQISQQDRGIFAIATSKTGGNRDFSLFFPC
jgi:hypothetical protein